MLGMVLENNNKAKWWKKPLLQSSVKHSGNTAVHTGKCPCNLYDSLLRRPRCFGRATARLNQEAHCLLLISDKQKDPYCKVAV